MQSSSRDGFVLILVLVVIALLTMAGFTFSELMFTERKATTLSGRQAQALAAAESGVQMANFFLTKDKQSQDLEGGWFDNQSLFRGSIVVDDDQPAGRARFTIVAPLHENGIPTGEIRFGLENESTRLNLNTLLLIDKSVPNGGRTILMGLPGMTEQIADAILDWLDTDSQVRQFGAESEYYSALEPGYAPTNGPLTTLEELLLVRGVTPWLLFGCDINRNGIIDPDEPLSDSLSGVDNSDGSMNQGWAAYLTLYSAEKNVQSNGQPRININQNDMQTLYDQLKQTLGAEKATFIVAYRQNGPYPGNAKGVPAAEGTLDLTKKAKAQFNNVLDLIGAKVQVKFQGENKPKILESPLPNTSSEISGYLPALMDALTVNPATLIPGRININQAPRLVLEGIPGMTPDVVDQIIARRIMDPKDTDSGRKYETWLLSEGILTLDKMKSLMPFITCGGDVYRLQSIGYFEDGGVIARIEAIIDGSILPSRVLFWRDISNLGRGYDQETLGVDGMR